MWFTETPWPPVFLLSLVGIGLFLAWMGTRRGGYLVGVAAVVLACAAIVVVERAIVTEGERVAEEVHGLARAVLDDDVDAALAYFAETAVLEREFVRTAMRRAKISQVRITDMRVRLLEDGKLAESHFRANGTIQVAGASQHGPTRWRLTWRKMSDDWKIVRIQRLDPVAEREIAWFAPPGR